MFIDLFGGRYELTAETVGGRRPSNQDNWAWAAVSGGTVRWVSSFDDGGEEAADRPDMLLAVVCDGMGGMSHGEYASAATANRILEWARSGDPGDDIGGSLIAAMAAAEERLSREYASSGTTVSAVVARDGRWSSVHVGDSRCYRVRPDGVWRTVDQSPVERMYRDGEISEAEMNTHPMSNIMDWCIGNGGSAHALVDDLGDGWDRLVLCSDGAFGYMAPDDFRDVATQSADAGAIVTEAYSRGSTDNITALMVRRARIAGFSRSSRPGA